MQEQFSVEDLSCHGAASSVDSITDYNEFYSICLCYVQCRHGVTSVLLYFTELIVAWVAYQNRVETLLQ